jgi:hypothetical protein
MYTLCIPCVYLVYTLYVSEHIRYTHSTLILYLFYTHDKARTLSVYYAEPASRFQKGINIGFYFTADSDHFRAD